MNVSFWFKRILVIAVACAVLYWIFSYYAPPSQLIPALVLSWGMAVGMGGIVTFKQYKSISIQETDEPKGFVGNKNPDLDTILRQQCKDKLPEEDTQLSDDEAYTEAIAHRFGASKPTIHDENRALQPQMKETSSDHNGGLNIEQLLEKAIARGMLATDFDITVQFPEGSQVSVGGKKLDAKGSIHLHSAKKLDVKPSFEKEPSRSREA